MDAASMDGRDIREIRMRLGMTQAEFAKRLGLGQSIVSAYERGETLPGAAIRPKLAELSEQAGMHLFSERTDPERYRLEGELRAYKTITTDFMTRIERVLKACEERQRAA